MTDRINLHTQYLKIDKDHRAFPFTVLTLISLIASLSLMIFFVANIKISNNRLLKEEQEIMAYIESEDNLKNTSKPKKMKRLLPKEKNFKLKLKELTICLWKNAK